MEPRLVKPPGQDLVVERLKSRYGLGGSRFAEYDFSNFDQAKWKRRLLTSPDDLGIFSSGDKVGSSLRCYSDERKHCTTPLCSSFKHLNVNCLDDELDSFQDLKQREKKEELIENDHRISTSKITKQSFKDIGKAQQEFAEELQKRECFLVEREQLLFRHETALSKIKGVEEEVLTRFQIIKEQHDAEVEHLTEVLKERNKESKRLRSSFDALKELNDNLKKQLNEVSEENKKMEIQAKRVQARLDNLQRKYEFMTIQRLKGNSHAANEMKSLKQDKVPVSKTHKWVASDISLWAVNNFDKSSSSFHEVGIQHHLKIAVEESQLQNQEPPLGSVTLKLLPVMTEQLQWMPFVNTKLHEPFVKFIYWSLRQLDAGTQHSTMTSTLRRLGEDIFKGVVTKGIQDNSLEHSVENKPKTAAFFKSSNLPLRFLSTLIVLKTVTQADYLAQAFDSLCLDLKTDEGKVLFLEYQAVPVILNHLRISSKGLLSNVIDSLLQMTVESKCATKLMYLFSYRSNKKLFELFTIHLMLQELQRTTHPEQAFLCINLNSTLFNLGLTKRNSLASNASH
ncbi:coiled-coil domain-containing protein 138 [Leptonychotes weddellii]|uniref:Coiled-coil domain-containing protein 138 n=1 Tax=Leptonychotes weddellii TaxID=9713 RepID=A0A7F8QA50_LEPWE|nr:coiled-coil domain-containing protein 138 [Leptonychotes weddellii]